jgi:cytochrome c peroxidase
MKNKHKQINARLASGLAVAALGLAVVLSGSLTGCVAGKAPAFPSEQDVTPAADSIGERLFLDTRFAQFFAAHMTATNDPLTAGDPVVSTVESPNGPLPGPFAGQSINCRSCHFVTEFQDVPKAHNRTYADFTTRSPIPLVMGTFDHTPRNSMQMVGSLQPHAGPALLHFDGEFATPEALVRATLTGRNFGWNPSQSKEAIAHIARIIREDDGSSQLAIDRTNGLSYGILMLGTDPRITSDLLLPPSQRLDVKTASDDQIVDEISMMISTYMGDLLFSQDEFGRYIGSPYDNFLRVNHLPVQPLAGETKAHYNQRLFNEVVKLKNPTYITAKDGSFRYHDQTYQFGPQELAGLIIFLRIGTPNGDDSQHAGNCAACHQAPDFSDFLFHATGVSQDEYDALHGTGAFFNLPIPGQAERTANFDRYLPASANHPSAGEAFRHAASASNPEFADLGLWNVYLNPDIPAPQTALKTVVCSTGRDCSVDQGLAGTIAQFKTPTLRDLEDSAPYFHNGSRPHFEDVISFYITSSQLAHSGALRNAPSEFAQMHLTQDDIAALAAFLKSLTEDYDDA